ncbi:MAG TPA: hypothetical protein VIZ28_12540 [Chitinophagaceae bacterium]
MTSVAFNPARTEPFMLFMLIAVIILTVLAGRDLVAWLLMKLYEIFIQQNPVSI